MSTNYKKLGEIVELIDERNKSLESSEVLGISIDKEFMPSVANTIGTDLSNYKLLRMNTFACNPMHVGRDERLPVSLYKKDIPAIVSPAYFMFRVKDENKVLPDFLMLIFKRDDFDRNCWFRTDGSVRGGITWNDICEIELPVPDLKEQEKIINTYKAITKRIQLKQKINENLEKTAECLFEKNVINNEQTEKGFFSQLINLSIGGDWGKEFEEGNYKKKVTCIRGADIPDTRIGLTVNAPIRYILQKNYDNKSIQINDFVVEISGGSPTQSTGRITYISKELRNHSLNDLICSNFCRVLRLKDSSHQFFYQYWNYLYNKGVMFNYENSSTGLKNFDLDTFINNEEIKIPSKETLDIIENCISKLMTKIYYNGIEIEK